MMIGFESGSDSLSGGDGEEAAVAMAVEVWLKRPSLLGVSLLLGIEKTLLELEAGFQTRCEA